VGIGPQIRHRLGRLEIPAAEAYRNRFINLDDLATTLASLTTAKRILEIGCGDGALAERLCRVFPDTEYLGIDIASEPGRLFRGDAARATFRSMSSADLLAEEPDNFDLVVIVDVVHHVPEGMRAAVLADAAELVTRDGMIAVKDWERGRGIAHLMAYTADRYVTGDKNVRFPSRDELGRLIGTALGEFEIVCEARIPPRRNNVLYALSRSSV
jgi:2-polyprenyl-6-hydroxyphenyl methylase/3-demethylubiquinone-9 3-methyltransferase